MDHLPLPKAQDPEFVKSTTAGDDDAAFSAEEESPSSAGEEEGAGEEGEEEAAETEKKAPLPKRVAKTSIAFKSDVESSPESRAAHPRGILHATKCASPASPSSREEHAFAWIADNADEVVHAVVDHLSLYGFRPSLMRFIPFSSKENWIARYPHAMPYVDCDAGGNIAGNVPSWEDLLGDADAGEATSSKKKQRKKTAKGKKPPPKLLENGRLPNRSRDELHIAIHEYFAWLHGELSALETNDTGRRRIRAAGVNVPGLGSLVSQLEATFSAVRLEKEQKEALGTDATAGDGGGAERAASTPAAEDGAPVGVPKLPPLEGVTNARPLEDVTNARPPPFLEMTLEYELDRRAGARPPRRRSNNPTGQRAEWRLVPFDVLLRRLAAFRAEHGHARVPYKHAGLGKWVCQLRMARKALRREGMEYAPDAPAALAGPDADGRICGGDDGDGGPASKRRRGNPPAEGNTFLTEERVRQLDAVGFVWTGPRSTKPWDEWFEELRMFRQQNGRWPANKEGSLGGWLKRQRKLYSERDAGFMRDYYPKLNELGVPLRQMVFSAAPRRDRFQQLVEFGRANHHFNVPNPDADQGDVAGVQSPAEQKEKEEARRFYKYVLRLQTEYRMWKRGLPTTMISEERIARLREIGFDFAGAESRARKERTVPELDWGTRMQQMEAFLSEMGHLRVDPNYGMYGNLGGWAVQMSELHKRWREGREYLPPDTVEQLNQLGALGFGFDVFVPRHGERSWEDSFGLLLHYQQETGSCRVPHHYKADFRLGSWVAVQRKEYKLLAKGQRSNLTQERIQRLESIGFEWAVKRGE